MPPLNSFEHRGDVGRTVARDPAASIMTSTIAKLLAFAIPAPIVVLVP
jgi:hypothetical protein